MGLHDGFLHMVQCYVAVQAIGPSALRNQGSPGVIGAARKFLSHLDLSGFISNGEESFMRQLDRETTSLLHAMPKKAQNWGAARKAINLFLRDALYNQYLEKEFVLHRIESWLEIPLDSVIAVGLKKQDIRRELPDWPGLKKLTPLISSRFQ